jgi:hypothetical protein
MKPQGYVPPSAAPGAHEGADLALRPVVTTAIVFAVVLAGLLGFVLVLFRIFGDFYPHRTSEAAPIVMAKDLPPQPRLQIDPSRDLQRTHAAEDRHLNRYAWVDRTGGVSQIPIDRAMTLWVQAYAAAPATNSAPASVPATELEMRQEKAQESGHVP